MLPPHFLNNSPKKTLINEIISKHTFLFGKVIDLTIRFKKLTDKILEYEP